MGFFDPRSRSDEDYQKDVDSGKYDAFRRSDVGGVYTYQTTSDGATLIKDVEPADNDKGHQQNKNLNSIRWLLETKLRVVTGLSAFVR